MLFVFLILHFLEVVFSLACPIPCGLFTPVFALGAVIGRLYGSILNQTLTLDGLIGGYAVVGAAALTSCVTHTISVSVIVFELTG